MTFASGNDLEVLPKMTAMLAIWGLVVIVLSILAWGGQTVSWFAPRRAVRWGLMEAESDVEPTYWADIRGEAAWDALSLWPMAVAGVLMILNNAAWAYFGLAGGAVFVYFAGRGIFTRLEMRRRGFRIGATSSVKLGLTFLAIWGAMGVLTIVAAVAELT